MLSFAANIPQGLGSCATRQRSAFCHTTLCGECRPPTNVSHVRPFRAKALTRKQIVNAIARNATPVNWAFRGASNVPHSWFCFLHSRMVVPKRRLKSVFR